MLYRWEEDIDSIHVKNIVNKTSNNFKLPNLVTSNFLCSRHINITIRQKVQNYTKCIHCIDEGRHVTNPHSGANRPLTHPPESSMGIIFFPSTRIMETIPSHSCPLPGSLGVWPFFPVAALLETYWRATLSPLQTLTVHLTGISLTTYFEQSAVKCGLLLVNY